MYLSELSFDRLSGFNPYEIHRLLWKYFPRMPDSERPFLFRVEDNDKRSQGKILMQSKYAPDLSFASKNIQLLRSKEFAPAFKIGQVIRFFLCANPTKRLSKERCRVPFIKEEDLTSWLTGKMEPCGSVQAARVVSRKNLHFQKAGNPGKVATVTFDGLLQVNDPDKLNQLLINGIGTAKSFGCGLLSLARA